MLFNPDLGLIWVLKTGHIRVGHLAVLTVFLHMNVWFSPFLQIERIQNPSLWRNLQIKKQEMDSKNCHQNNEKRLFHGTCPLIIDTINANGFNRSYAGKNGKMYKMTNTRVIK